MSKSSVAVLCVAVLIAACGLSFGQAEQKEASPAEAVKKWEYKVIRLTGGSETATESLNQEASEGWELLECYQVFSRAGAFATNAILKRVARPSTQ